MDLRALRYFITVLEAGSISRAAHSLYVAQPALTAQIKKLESELGVQLLERTHAGVTATPAGTRLYEDARRLLSDADAMCERLQRLPMGPEGSVSIAMPFLLTGLLMGPVIAGLRQSHPRIRVFVLDDSSLMVQKAMLERRADLGVLVDTASLQGLQVQPMATEPIYFCGHDAQGKVAPCSIDTARRKTLPAWTLPMPQHSHWCCSHGAFPYARRWSKPPAICSSV
jgi:DNA-binding transcriptional LysR family regulator